METPQKKTETPKKNRKRLKTKEETSQQKVLKVFSKNGNASKKKHRNASK